MEEQDDNGALSYLSQGANVEVLSKEKGSVGAWFPATVLDPPANPSASKRKSFTSNKVLIQYKTLVSEEDPTKLHVEYTTLSLLRPSPPADNAEERFEQNNVVDAFDLDGCWTGVVMSVVGEKYTVGFKKPPDLLEVERSELRSHWEWDHGVWARAPKELVGGSNYMSGTAVEVNLKRDHLWFSWLPAIYLGQVGIDSFLVRYRYETLENIHENGLVKVVIADHQIRPRSPPQEKTDFHLYQMVDAFFDKCWWVGEITNVLAKEKYVVTFKFTREVKEFCHSHLRCHLEWVDKQWVTRFLDYGGQPRYARESSSKFVGKRPSRTKCRMKQPSLCMDQLPCGNPIDKLKISQCQHPKEDSLQEVKRRRFTKHLISCTTYWRRTPPETSKRKGLVTNQELNEQQQVGQLDSLAITVEKRGTQPNPQSIGCGRKGIPQILHVSNGSKMVRGDQEYIEDENVTTMIESFGIPSEPEASAGLQAGNSSLLPVKDIKHDNGDGVNSGIVGKEKQAELLVQHSKNPAAGGMNDKLEKPASLRWNQNLITYQRKRRFKPTGNPVWTINRQGKKFKIAFHKRFTLWEHFESMEVFKNIPQKPHFHPLLKKKDVYREGLGIGSMVGFASLVEKISCLRVDDPKEVIEICMEGLVEMESMGFDVKAIRHRLTELQDMKVKFKKESKENHL